MSRINWNVIPRELIDYYEEIDNEERRQQFHDHYSSQIPNYYLDDTGEPPSKVPRVEASSTTQDEPGPSGIQDIDDSSQVSSSEVDSQLSIPETVGEPTQLQGISSTVVEEVDMSLTGTRKGQGGIGDGNSNSSMPLYVTPSPYTNFGKKFSTYKKVHRFITFGIAHNWIQLNTTGPPVEIQQYLTTHLAEVPWHKVFLYLNKSEFDLLPNGSYCKEIRIKIVCRGVRIAFETNAVETSLATLNQIQNISVGYGLNKTGWGVNKSYTAFNATQSMLPTAIAAPSYTNYPQEMYGNANTTINQFIPSHQLGFKMVLNNYFNLVTRQANFGGTPCIAEKIKFMDGKTAINQVVAEYKWSPRHGMLKKPLDHIRWGLPAFVTNTPNHQLLTVHTNGNLVNGNNLVVTSDTVNSNGNQATINQTTTQPTNFNTTGDFSFLDDIDKSQFYRQGPWGQNENPEIQPSVHVGVQAIPALTTSVFFTPINKWSDSQCDWEIFAEMDIGEYLPTAFPYATDGNVPAGDQYYRTLPTGIFPESEDACTFAGLYPTNSIL